MKMCDFVEWELNMYRQECNFTEEELAFFNLRSKNKSLIQIQLALEEVNMPCSETKVNDLSKSVKRKILKIPPKIVRKYKEEIQ